MLANILSSCKAIMPQFYVGGDLNFNLNVSLSGDGWVVVAVGVVAVIAFAAGKRRKNP